MKSIEIPNKLYFRIGEVASLLGIKPYVLRYWETEFPDIKPAKSKSGQRLYKRRDVLLLVKIRELLYEERFTINGARKRLKEEVRAQKSHEEEPEQIALHLPTGEVETHTLTLEKLKDLPAKIPTEPVSGDQRKIFAKIKKDLESVLATLRS